MRVQTILIYRCFFQFDSLGKRCSVAHRSEPAHTPAAEQLVARMLILHPCHHKLMTGI